MKRCGFDNLKQLEIENIINPTFQSYGRRIFATLKKDPLNYFKLNL